MPLKTYRDLVVWNRAMDLVLETYFLTKQLPRSEQFGLISQMRRAALSIASNIAEGYGRSHRGDYTHHLSISRGSLCELETQLIVCGRLKYLSKADAQKAWGLCQEAGKMLTSMLSKLKPS